MKKYLLVLLFLFPSISEAQVICIKCYDQNARVLNLPNDLILNGSLENTTCNAYPPLVTFCPSSTLYPVCSIADWTCMGGGSLTYACMLDSNYTTLGDGHLAAYFGSHYAHACSATDEDTSCFTAVGCEVTGFAAGYPTNLEVPYGGDTGLVLSQTVTGLSVSSVYLLEFWAGGEWSFTSEGLFAVDVGFGNIFLRDPVTPANAIGRRFVIAFRAASSSHTIKFTNWGHITANSTELVLDDVRMFRGGSEVDCATLEINEPVKNSALNFYPNPAHDKLNVECTSASLSAGTAELKIYDVTGREVYSTVLHAKHETLNPGLSPALYFVELSEIPQGGMRVGNHTQKLVIE